MWTKTFLSLILLLSSGMAVLAQDETLKTEVLESGYSRVLIVPFHPRYYISDSDQELARANGKRPAQLAEDFRVELNNNVYASVRQRYDAVPLLAERTPNGKENLKEIYRNLNYVYDTTSSYVLAQKQREQVSRVSLLRERIKKLGKKGELNPIGLKEGHELEFMNVKLDNPQKIQEVAQQYGADLIVFINQFEIKINYSNCIDLANQNYGREFRMHFSIYDARGNFLFGDVCTSIFPSNDQSFDMIVRNNFPLLAGYLFKNLPG